MSIYAFPISAETHTGSVTYENWFTPEQCAHILAMNSNASKRAGGVVRSEGDEVAPNIDYRVRRVDVVSLWVNDANMFIFDRLNEAVMDANQHFFKFDLSGFMEHSQLLYYTEPTSTESGGFYDWHTDTGVGSLATRKLTLIVQLTDPSEYEGCEVELMGHGPINKQLGALTIFPSYMSHRVTELTKGHRESIVAWANGHPFR